MNTPFDLLQLQKIDSRLTALNQRLLEISFLLKNNPALNSAKNALEITANEVKSATDVLKLIESKILDKRNKLEQSESSLYGGKIKNPKELQDLQKEISSIKIVLSSLEDEQFNLMISAEEKESCHNEAIVKYNEASIENERIINDLTKEANGINQEKNKLTVERELLLKQIPEDIFQKYENLRFRKGGVAVARVEDLTCTMCGAGLTPSERQSAKSPSSLFFCASCGRILYAD